MKNSFFFILPAILLASQASVNAQVYSQNLVGYANITFNAGVNLFGNPLDSAPNDLDSIINDDGTEIIPNGTTVSLWNPTTDSFGPGSVFNNGSWSVDLTLLPGTGAELIAPSSFSTTFVGNVDGHDGNLLTQMSLPP